MLSNIREHWAEFQIIRDELIPDDQGAVYLKSKDKRRLGVVGGRISCVGRQGAALMLVQDTHELAKPDEIAKWKADQAETKRVSEQEAAKKDAKVQINLGDMLNTLLAQKLTQDQAATLSSQQPAKRRDNPQA